MSLGKDQEKTEQATPKRREEARKKGQVAHSREVPSVLVLLSSLGVLFFSGSFMFWHISSYMGGIFENLGAWQFGDASIQAFLLQVMKEILVILMPLMLFVLVAGIGANVIQVGFMITGEPLVPKLSKLNPIKGLKRLFSLKAFVELAKSVFKILLVVFIAFLMVRGELETIPTLCASHLMNSTDHGLHRRRSRHTLHFRTSSRRCR